MAAGMQGGLGPGAARTGQRTHKGVSEGQTGWERERDTVPAGTLPIQPRGVGLILA